MSLDKEIVVHPDLPLPYAHYSSAVRAGEFLFISGQAGIDPQTNKKAGEDFETQARQAFENLKTCLTCSGATMSDVVKVTTFLGDASKRDELNAMFQEYFPVDPPARSSPIVNLPMNLLLSIEAIAVDRAKN